MFKKAAAGDLPLFESFGGRRIKKELDDFAEFFIGVRKDLSGGDAVVKIDQHVAQVAKDKPDRPSRNATGVSSLFWEVS
jgi:hypothetical protein